MSNFRDTANFIWSIAELLRGDYKQADYGKVILPMTVLRRLDCVLEPSKPKIFKALEKVKNLKLANIDSVLAKEVNLKFHNISQYDFDKLVADPNHIAANLKNYINGFSQNARDIIDYFSFSDQINRLDDSNLLYLVVKQFQEVNLHPNEVNNHDMGYIFEELIRKFSELSNETAGEHFTPREVIRLMVNLLLCNDNKALTQKGIIKKIYDPACGTGGMLSIAEEYIHDLNPDSRAEVFGQELNPESYAICKADMLIKGEDPEHIKFGNSFSNDGLPYEKFDYMLSNPPFGVEWKKVEKEIRQESESLGFGGRFGAGLPRISDGSLMFLQHMISKMNPPAIGSRLAIVFNGSPLFTGGAGSGESDIRKWIIENDMLEAIIAMPDQLFYNTGISTYIWIVTNRKEKKRLGKVQLINAVSFFKKMSKSLGNKRNEISAEHINEITKLYGNFEENEYCKIFPNNFFGYWRITVERPLRLNFRFSDERIQLLKGQTAFTSLSIKKSKGSKDTIDHEGKQLQEDIIAALKKCSDKSLIKNRTVFLEELNNLLAKSGLKLKAPIIKAITNALSERDETTDICYDSDNKPEPDSELRDFENVPLQDDIQRYFDAEVLPHVPDAWIDHSKTKTGYEISFTKYFYKYQPLRSLEEIRKDIIKLENETSGLLGEII